MLLSFIKMHGLGNDFVLVNGFSNRVTLTDDQVRRLADRHSGVGCDQVLVVEPPQRGEADVRYRIYNADGGEVEHCGNGVRCVARYLRDEGLVDKDEILVETSKGLARVYIEKDGLVRVNMGAPRLEPADIPMVAANRANLYDVKVAGGRVSVGVVSVGNPHAVLQVDNVDRAPVSTLGPMIERHSLFPEGVNVGFMQVVKPSYIRLRVFERGTGETLACGTGACAAVVIGRLHGRLASQVEVELPGGLLRVNWEGEGEPVWMIGPAARVFVGHIQL
ncbi:MAG: diaminopimelate epimerase [Chromatiales bacterium]